jgi:hypothetical protein
MLVDVWLKFQQECCAARLIGSEHFRQARRHEDVWGSRDNSTHSFLHFSWFIEFACKKIRRNNVEVVMA